MSCKLSLSIAWHSRSHSTILFACPLKLAIVLSHPASSALPRERHHGILNVQTRYSGRLVTAASHSASFMDDRRALLYLRQAPDVGGAEIPGGWSEHIASLETLAIASSEPGLRASAYPADFIIDREIHLYLQQVLDVASADYKNLGNVYNEFW